MKTLANCTLSEFLKQVNKIRHNAEDFYKTCLKPVFLKKKEEFEKIGDSQTLNEKGKTVISDILDVCLEKETDKTIEIIGMCCFMTKEEAESKLSPADLIDIVLEMLSSKRVIDFFYKMVNLGRSNTVTA